MSGVLLVIVFLMLFILVVGVLALLFRKPPRELADLATKAAVITEKIERVEAIPNEVNALKVELGRLLERVAGVEQNQNNVNQSVGGFPRHSPERTRPRQRSSGRQSPSVVN
jgi:hypothetical protein